MKKTVYNSIIAAVVILFVAFACKKKEPIANDTRTLSDLSSEYSTITPTVSTTGGTTGSTTGGTTTGGTTTGGTTGSTTGSTTGPSGFVSWTFWADASRITASGNGIYVYVDGSYVGTITTGYSSAPSCGATGAVTQYLPSGTHTWYAESATGSYVWGSASNPRVSTVTASCTRLQLY